MFTEVKFRGYSKDQQVSVSCLPCVMADPLLMEANKALRSSEPESPPPPEGPLKSIGGGGGPGGGGGGGHPPEGALGGAAEAAAMDP